MWYLCRKPCNLPSKDLSIISRTSIFSTSNSGHLEDISFIITDDDNNNNEQNANQTVFGNPWQWYAYECTPMQFVGVAVPRHTQVISVMPEYFLCVRIVFPSSNEGLKYAKLCSYSRQSSQLFDIQSCMELEEGYNRNLVTAASAILNGWLYVAGGYKALTSSEAEEKALEPLGSAERLNLATMEWEALPKMLKPEANATGIAFRGLFYCIGGENHKHSAQIYHPKSKKWVLTKQFIPQEADGYSVGSVGGRMILLTWSTFLGVKLWRYNVIPKAKKWTFVGFYADTKVARSWLDHKGPKLVRIKKHLFIMTGVDDNFCWVDGLSAWPTLPGPSFHMCDEGKLSKSGFISAVKFTVTNAHSWDCYPVYRIENAL
ncbi:uncharacterized protein LOC141591489 [Silene latifolia]|uniref:uncharacterized protein LOC141591489 n=1 Tax=Silene latifolia TaxID=37657 RepID=UPI003D776D4A